MWEKGDIVPYILNAVLDGSDYYKLVSNISSSVSHDNSRVGQYYHLGGPQKTSKIHFTAILSRKFTLLWNNMVP